MPRRPPLLVSSRDFLTKGARRVLSEVEMVTRVVKKKGPPIPHAQVAAQAAQAATAAALPPGLPRPEVVELPPAPLAPMAHDSPTLHDRVRPDLPPLAQRLAQKREAFMHPDRKIMAQKKIGGAANHVLHLDAEDGHSYVVKPHATAAAHHEPDKWAARNHAAAAVLEAMGVGHMGVEGFHGDHDGSPAQVYGFAGDTIRATDATESELARVDGLHRVHGLIHHVLFSNSDGHHGNVLIHAKTMHPILIDNDLSLASEQTKIRRDPNTYKENRDGRTAVRSVFAPGEDLDYRRGRHVDPATGEVRELGEIGTDFEALSPRLHKTLVWLAAGGHAAHENEGGLGLDPEDAMELQKNARDLLAHGLEQTLARRHLLPTYKREAQEA